MKLNGRIINEVLNQLSVAFSNAHKNEFKHKFKSFAKTINAMNKLTSEGISSNYLIASDGMQHSISEYKITPDLKQLILPAKVAIADGMLTEELRNVPYYSSDDDLGPVELMTPYEFENFQSLFYIMSRTQPPTFESVYDVKNVRYDIVDIQGRLAVFEGYSTLIGKLLFSKITGNSVGDILAKAPTESMVPIVVNIYFEKSYAYNVNAEDIVINYFVKHLLLTK